MDKSVLKAMLAVGAVLALLAGPAAAQVNVTITNPSFEDPALAEEAYTVTGDPVTGWTLSSVGIIGVSDLTAATDYGAADGENALYINPDDIGLGGTTAAISVATQTVTESIVGGETYTLTVALNSRRTFDAGAYKVALLVDGVEVAADDNSVTITPSDTWTSTTVTWTALVSDHGKTLSIQLTESATSPNTGVQVLFDDVSLTRTPEPASLALLGFSSLLLFKRRRAVR